ncbi:MAG: AraC family transcriptional regulator [Spirochaetes bacterium]|nr:AraC family transcriptional regulator [Spirochaetota bacterium]
MLLFFITYVNLFAHLEYINSPWNLPVFSFLRFPVSILLGPVMYLYILSLTEEKTKLVKTDFIHFPPAVIFPLAGYIYLYHNLSALSNLKSQNHVISWDTGLAFLNLIGLTAIAYLIFYISLSIRNIFKSIKKGIPLPSSILLLLIILFLSLLLAVTAIEIIITRSELLFYLNRILNSIIIIVLFLVNQWKPYFLMHNTYNIKKERKSKSYLSKINLSQLDKQLKTVMEKEKFYCDEDLTLKRLSDALDITPHQLSEFLNEHHKKNFKHFVNSYRIEEAKEQLQEQPDRNALTIALAVGFNSYTTFHTTFKKEVGQSPNDFRRSILKKTRPKGSATVCSRHNNIRISADSKETGVHHLNKAARKLR